MRSTLLLMLASAVFGSGLAIAQSTLANAPENASSRKTPHALAKFSERFQAADQDGDGALTRAEAETGGISKIANHFERLDANSDGKVSPEEVRALLRQRPLT
jgi:Ca2+-binding EF-hand superfamily protein